ncbi:invasion associated locus B family protein [Methylocapsa palsarum]|uniref:Invasion protein IalB, involved in pathogenesis n=1 Tax=Methylocapsa palsarum TaxID=1612308 RepID=A0A1I4BR58_9HYPH|nr:invasion associated locus B family protein [Methylocapsa palsarum]SFK70900.1 Invasion protein IalB, involved in pathogenesis [Methylocapsa palsarum]
MRAAWAAVVSVAILLCLAASPLRAVESSSDAKQKPAEAPKAPAGPDSTTENFADWSLVCAAPTSAADRSCEVNTTLTIRGQSSPFARIAFARLAKDKPMRLIALVPVNVSTALAVKIAADSGKADISLPFKSCVPAGCLAEAELSKDQLQGFRGQAKAAGQMTLVDAAGKSATLTISLRGLDQALDAFFRQQEK